MKHSRFVLVTMLYYGIIALAIFSFVLAVFCASRAYTFHETVWWMYALKTGAASILLWILAWFIDIRKEK